MTKKKMVNEQNQNKANSIPKDYPVKHLKFRKVIL